MKLTTIILIAAIMQVSAASYGQRVTFSQRNVTLDRVFSEIRKQTGYNVFLLGAVKSSEKMDADFNNLPLSEVLDIVFDQKDISYTIEDKTIIAKRKEPSIFERIVDRFQAVDIYGRVTDEDGIALVGASVMVKNKNQVTKTNGKGEFALRNVDEKATLVVTYVGYQQQEVHSIKDINNVIVRLKPSVAGLEEVEVTINTGYQQIKPEQSTGSISVLNRKEYESRINTTDFLAGLQNKIPGLLINNDIKFEGNGLFQIRGISTINGNRKPLIVVDGYPTELSLDMIDPNEIESVTVLKDAAAATIYGARSSNGVIIIERKKARAGNLRINARVTTSYRPKENFGRYRWDDDGSKTVVDYQTLSNFNVGPTVWATLQSAQGSLYGYNPVGLVMAHWRSSANPITIEERDRQLAEIASYNNSSDYSRLFFRTAATQTYNVDLSGGSDRVLYYVTANYSGNQSNQLGNENGIFRLSGRSTLKLSNRLTLELNLDLQQGKVTSAPIPDINNIFPYQRFQDDNGNPVAMYNTFNVQARGNTLYNQYLKSLGLLDNAYYPVTEMNEVSDINRTVSNRITANFRYNAGRGFSFGFGGVQEYAQTDGRHLASENSTEVRQYVNYYTKPGSNGLIFNIPKGTFLKQQASGTRSFTARAQANYDKQIGDHSLNVILGTEIRKAIQQSNTASYFGYNDQTLNHQPVDFNTLLNYTPTYASSNTRIAYNSLFSQGYSDDRFLSGYSNLVYAYKSKYSVTGSIRIDQSNLFGTDPKYKYKPLWSVGAGWNIHKERFMEDVDWVRSLRLRIAHGFNGNVAKNALPQVIAIDGVNTMNPTASFPMLNLGSYANSGLRWEQSRNFNIGLNYKLFKGITGNIDYYIKTSTDVLANNQIDASKGGVAALINQASIRNNGFELSLQADWITRRNFNWNTGFVFARNTNKILKVYNPNITPSSAAAWYVDGRYSSYLTGYAVGSLFSYQYAGINNTGYATVYNKKGEVINYADNAALLTAAVDYAGSSIPVVNFGLSNRVDIGSFYGYFMINYFGDFAARVPVPNASDVRPLKGAGKYWKQAGDEKDPDALPLQSSPNGSIHYFAMATSNKYTVNGSYFTLGDVTAAYSFRKSKLIKSAGLANLEIKVQASNLYTVALNKYNFSAATGSYAKSYLTPTYSGAVSFTF